MVQTRQDSQSGNGSHWSGEWTSTGGAERIWRHPVEPWPIQRRGDIKSLVAAAKASGLFVPTVHPPLLSRTGRQREGVEMAEPTREEYDAKLEATEARLQTFLVGLDGKLDRVLDRLNVVGEEAHDARTAAYEARNAAANVKWNILFAALGSIALMLAVWAIWTQGMEMIGTLLSAKPDSGT